MVKLVYDATEDMLFIYGARRCRYKESMPISDNFTVDFDVNYRIKAIEISFAYEFFKEFDPVNFRRNILKDVKKAEFNVKEHRDLVLIEIVFVYKNKKIREKLVF